MIVNDGDEDEGEETFGIKVGYVIGDNKAETVTIGIEEINDNGTPTDLTDDFSDFATGEVVVGLNETLTDGTTNSTFPGTPDAIDLVVSSTITQTMDADVGSTTTPDQVISSIDIGDVTSTVAAGLDLESSSYRYGRKYR